MVDLIISANCGNSPKQELIKQFNIAFAANNSDTTLDMVTDDITWEIVGEQKISGKVEAC